MKAKLLTLLFVFGTTWSLFAVQHNVDSFFKETYNSTNSTWEKRHAHRKYYDAQCKNRLLENYFTWNTTALVWDSSAQFISSYDINGNLTSNSSRYISSNSLHINDVDSFYYVGNLLTYSISQIWIPSHGIYLNTRKQVYHRDVNQRVDTIVVYAWDTTFNTWKPSLKFFGQFDAFGNETTGIAQSYNTLTMNFLNIQKSDYAYSASNKILTSVNFTWDSTNSVWINHDSSSANYNTGGFQTDYTQENWNGTGWTNSSKVVNTLNLDGEVTIALLFDFVSGAWVSNNNRTTYYYGCTIPATGIEEAEADKVQLFPNPATKTLQVSMPTLEGSTLLSVLNLQGQIVKEQPAMRGVNTIGVENLTTGTYLLKWDNNGRVQTKQFVKE